MKFYIDIFLFLFFSIDCFWLMVLLEVAELEMQMPPTPHIRMRHARHTAPESATCTTARQRDRASSAAAHMLGCLHPPVQAASTRAHNMFVSAKLMLSHHAKGAALVPIFERKLPSSRRRKMSSRLAAAASCQRACRTQGRAAPHPRQHGAHGV